MRVQLSVLSLRKADGDCEELRFTVPGEFLPMSGGGTITYQDPSEGMKGTLTTLNVTEKSVIITNKGIINSCLVVESGKCHLCRYDTGYGVLSLKITGERIENGLQEHPKTLEFMYTLSMQGGCSHHTLRLTLRPIIG